MKNSVCRVSFLFLSLSISSLTAPHLSSPKATKTLLSQSAAVSGQHMPSSGIKNQDVERSMFTWFRTFSEAVHLVAKKHYNAVDIPSFFQNALKAALPKTDPHSSFFSQKSYKDAIDSTSGKFSGIGVSVMNKAPEDDALIIIDVIRGGPSDKAGIVAGDKIMAIDNTPLKGLSSDEVITKLRGKVGTTVSLKLIRNKKPIELKIKREVIKDQNLSCYHFKNQNIHYYSLKMFADNSYIQMKNFLEEANKAKSRGHIIDLRRNPGGVLDSAVNMVGLFVNKGSQVVSTKDNAGKVVSSYSTQNNPVHTSKTPIFILTDNFTASAAEIFTGCLKHYSEKNQNNLLVFHVGSETFGKGSVQEVIPISNGCALKLTTMTYILPDDVPIQALGIKPDIEIKPKVFISKEAEWIKDLYGKESSLKNHIPAAGEKSEKPHEKEASDTTSKAESKEEIAKKMGKT